MTDSDLSDPGYGDEPAPPGHNNPPLTFEEELRRDHQSLFLRFEALKLERAKVPAKLETVADLAVAGKTVLLARGLVKDVDAAHKTASKPHKEKAKACDKVFLTTGLIGEIDNLRAVIQALADDYTERRAAAERKRLADEAAALRAKETNASYEAEHLREAGSFNVAEVVESQSEHIGKAAERMEAKADGGVANVVRTRMDGLTASGQTVTTYEIEDAAAIDLNRLREFIYDHELTQIIQRFVDRGGRELPGVRIYDKIISTFR